MHITDVIIIIMIVRAFVCCWRNSPQWIRTSSFTRSLDHTQRRATVCRTSLEGWSARSRHIYLTTHNNHNRHISMPPVGFEPTISAGKRPQTCCLDRHYQSVGTETQCVFCDGGDPSCSLMFLRVVIIRCKESFETVYVELKSSAGTATLGILNTAQLLIPTHAHFHWLKFIKNI
jgi:hypothetical protein